MITIVVPIYKVERYLPRCVESLIGQTYRDIEIILVDDGSPDRCGQICEEYAEQDKRIKVLHQQNAGVSVARNAGLCVATGEYIGFCDPDDWAAPDMYSELLSAMNDFTVDLSICGYNYYDESYQVDNGRLYKEKETELLDQKMLMDRMADMPPSIRHGVCNKLFKKSLLQGMTFDKNLQSSEDLKFLEEYAKKTSHAAVVHKPLYQNLIRANSATHGGLPVNTLWLSYPVHEEMYYMAIERYPELKNRAMAYLLDVLTLKYYMAKKKLSLETNPSEKLEQKEILKRMRKTIKHYAIKDGFIDRDIYWKTRISYLLLR